jgi:dihydroxyacetone kinase
MPSQTKKLINAPEAVIDEMLDGLVGAFPDLLHRPGPTGRAVVALDGPRDGKVGIVIGGGSGHEPAFPMYVGKGVADAAAVGNVFASPGPSQVVEAALAADGGAGLLFLYGNYAGDVMNFDMAAERLVAQGIEARSVLVTDDAASAPPDRFGERRGIAGGFFVYKCAGAAADLGHPLPEVERLARHANARTRSMGVALEPCSLPQTRRPNFEIPSGEMEVGMGVHGEPGIARLPLEPADAVADRLLTPLLSELALTDGDEVALLVNGLGATSMMELLILHRRVRTILAERGVGIRRSWTGEYVTALEMAGASISLLKLDAELIPLLEHPCRTPALVLGHPTPAPVLSATPRVTARPAEELGPETHETPLLSGGEITPAVFRTMMTTCAEAMAAARDALSALDGATGDGDHGVTMEAGWRAVEAALAALPTDTTISRLCRAASSAFLDSVGASAGPLYATGFARAADVSAQRRDLDASSLVAWIEAMAAGIQDRGGAAEGDKTMFDAWSAAAKAARSTLSGEQDASVRRCLAAAAQGAADGRDATAEMQARRGRAAKLGVRSLGHLDAGAASAALLVAALLDGFDRARGRAERV